MWIRAAGRLTDQVALVTTPASSHLLVIGEVGALVDSGVTYFSEMLCDEIEKLLPTGVVLKYLLLTGSDFDHIGGVNALKSRWPGLEVVCSPQCRERLSDRDCLSESFNRNVICSGAFDASSGACTDGPGPATTIDVGKVVGDGDTLLLGDGIEIKSVSCTGYSAEGMAYYVTAQGVLAVGDAVGAFHGRGKYSCSFAQSLSGYLSAIDRLATLDVRMLFFGHSGALSGDLAREYFRNARAAAESLVANIKEQLQQGKLKDEVVDALCLELVEQGVPPSGPIALVLREVVQGMVSAASVFC